MRWSAESQSEASSRRRGQDAVPFGVLPGEREGVDRDVEGDARGLGPLEKKRDRDDAAARAGVEHPPGAAGLAERLLDEDLRLRPRHERAAVHAERAAVEVPLADQVLDRRRP